MSAERESAGIVHALIGLGHGFGLTIAADGVDDPTHRASLVKGGCEVGQGNLFSEALSAEEAKAVFEAAGSPRIQETAAA